MLLFETNHVHFLQQIGAFIGFFMVPNFFLALSFEWFPWMDSSWIQEAFPTVAYCSLNGVGAATNIKAVCLLPNNPLIPRMYFFTSWLLFLLVVISISFAYVLIYCYFSKDICYIILERGLSHPISHIKKLETKKSDCLILFFMKMEMDLKSFEKLLRKLMIKLGRNN